MYDRTTSGAPVPAPREVRHSLSALVNGLVAQRLVLLHSSDSSRCTPDPAAEPGTWKHVIAIAPRGYAAGRPSGLLGCPARHPDGVKVLFHLLFPCPPDICLTRLTRTVFKALQSETRVIVGLCSVIFRLFWVMLGYSAACLPVRTLQAHG